MRIRLSILVWTILAAALTPALAEKRVALVIGNSDYQNVAPLTNPSNDAAAIAAILTKAGFDIVDTKSNLSGIEMKRALREFGNKVRDADVAVIYYAGHGIELEGSNYLIPVDAKLEIDTDVLDEAFPLERFIVAADPAKQLRLVILDACRDNPFNKTMKRTIGSRAVSRGLAKVEPTNPNTLVAFAAKAGSTASDGEGKNSPFATALVKHMTKPGLDLRKAFGFVRDDVLKATSNKQEPFVYGSLGGNDVSLVPAVAVAPPQRRRPMRMQPCAATTSSPNGSARARCGITLSRPIPTASTPSWRRPSATNSRRKKRVSRPPKRRRLRRTSRCSLPLRGRRKPRKRKPQNWQGRPSSSVSRLSLRRRRKTPSLPRQRRSRPPRLQRPSSRRVSQPRKSRRRRQDGRRCTCCG